MKNEESFGILVAEEASERMHDDCEFEDSLDSIIGDLIIDFTSDKMMEQIAKSLLEDSTTVDLLVQTLNDRY